MNKLRTATTYDVRYGHEHFTGCDIETVNLLLKDLMPNLYFNYGEYSDEIEFSWEELVKAICDVNYRWTEEYLKEKYGDLNINRMELLTILNDILIEADKKNEFIHVTWY